MFTSTDFDTGGEEVNKVKIFQYFYASICTEIVPRIIVEM